MYKDLNLYKDFVNSNFLPLNASLIKLLGKGEHNKSFYYRMFDRFSIKIQKKNLNFEISEKC